MVSSDTGGDKRVLTVTLAEVQGGGAVVAGEIVHADAVRAARRADGDWRLFISSSNFAGWRTAGRDFAKQLFIY